MFNFTNLMAANGGQASMSDMIPTLVMFVVIIAFFYFLMIRPQKKKEKEQKEMREAVQIGDEIMTIGGIVGFVVKKTEDTVVIETGGDKSKLRIKMWAIQENITISEKLAADKAAKNKAIMEASQKKKNKKNDNE